MSDSEKLNERENILENNSDKKRTNSGSFVLKIVVLIIFIAIFANSYILNFFMPGENDINKETTEKKENPEKESNFIQNTYLNKIDRADDITRKADLRSIRYALEVYFEQNGSYPISQDPVKLNNTDSTAYISLSEFASPSSFKDPNDPEYFYLYKSDGRGFEISARLENIDDPECEKENNGYCIYRIKL